MKLFLKDRRLLAQLMLIRTDTGCVLRAADTSRVSSREGKGGGFSFPLRYLNPLKDELNPICHFLILLGDSTFMGTCIAGTSNMMPRYTVYLYLETALHVSGGTSTHHQERIQLYLQHLLFVTPLLLSAVS
jgi:hypothetical protein